MRLGAAGEGYFISSGDECDNALERLIKEEYLAEDLSVALENGHLVSHSSNAYSQSDISFSMQQCVAKNGTEETLESILSTNLNVAKTNQNISASLCGHLLVGTSEFRVADEQFFNENILSWNDFDADPSLWYHPSLAYKFESDGPYVPSRIAMPVFASLMLFDKSLSPSAFTKLLKTRYQITDSKLETVELVQSNVPVSHVQTTQPFLFNCCSPRFESQADSELVINETRKLKHEQACLALKPTEEQLKALPLKNGHNLVEYHVASNIFGERRLVGSIYLWDEDVRIICSDVDGTITKSDIWGQVMPILGRDWSHRGVAELFSTLYFRGYKIVYITARAIGQANTTRDYLFNLNQDSAHTLPDGPLFLSPDRLFDSLKREVIDRQPFIYKTAVFSDIRNLFSENTNPFYGGFGNKYTDYLAYTESHFPENRIFIINPSGNITQGNTNHGDSYASLSLLVDKLFPKTSDAEIHTKDTRDLKALKKLSYTRQRK